MKPIHQSEITDKMFNDWKQEMRTLFKKDPNSMNLINIMLKGLDKNPQDIEGCALREKSLRGFYENSLSYENNILCDHCSEPMEVYYSVKCFKCDAIKPTLVDYEKKEGNLIMATKWLENKEEDFTHDEFWDALIKLDILEGNDRFISLPDVLQDNYCPEYNRLIAIWKKHLPVADIKWFVSW